MDKLSEEEIRDLAQQYIREVGSSFEYRHLDLSDLVTLKTDIIDNEQVFHIEKPPSVFGAFSSSYNPQKDVEVFVLAYESVNEDFQDLQEEGRFSFFRYCVFSAVEHLLDNFVYDSIERMCNLSFKSFKMTELSIFCDFWGDEFLHEEVTDINNIIDEILTHQVRITKSILQARLEMHIKRDVPPEPLFSIKYEELLPRWKEAKKFFTDLKKVRLYNTKEKKLKKLQDDFSDLPKDLLKVLSERANNVSSPNALAKKHAARILNIERVKARQSGFNVLSESRNAAKALSGEEIEAEIDYYLYHQDRLTKFRDMLRESQSIPKDTFRPKLNY